MKTLSLVVLLFGASACHAQIYTWDELGCYQFGADYGPQQAPIYRDGLGRKVDPKTVAKFENWRDYTHRHNDTWKQTLAKCRKLVAIKVSPAELEAYRKVQAINKARDTLEEEDRYNALGGEPEAEIRR